MVATMAVGASAIAATAAPASEAVEVEAQLPPKEVIWQLSSMILKNFGSYLRMQL